MHSQLFLFLRLTDNVHCVCVQQLCVTQYLSCKIPHFITSENNRQRYYISLHFIEHNLSHATHNKKCLQLFTWIVDYSKSLSFWPDLFGQFFFRRLVIIPKRRRFLKRLIIKTNRSVGRLSGVPNPVIFFLYFKDHFWYVNFPFQC